MKDDIIEKLEEVSFERNTQGRLASYLLEKDDVSNLTIQDLMNECYISVATATRLAKKLGLKGFGELKVYLVEAKKNQRIEDYSSGVISTQRFGTDLSSTMLTTFGNINERMLNKIVHAIHAGDAVDFFAVGGTNLIAQDFAFKLGRLNKHVTYYSDYHMQYVRAKSSTKKTIAIAISYSGSTPEILKSLENARENGAVTVLITRDPSINLPFIDILLAVETPKKEYRSYKLMTKITIMAILDLAYLKLLDVDESHYKELLERTKFIK